MRFYCSCDSRCVRWVTRDVLQLQFLPTDRPDCSQLRIMLTTLTGRTIPSYESSAKLQIRFWAMLSEFSRIKIWIGIMPIFLLAFYVRSYPTYACEDKESRKNELRYRAGLLYATARTALPMYRLPHTPIYPCSNRVVYKTSDKGVFGAAYRADLPISRLLAILSRTNHTLYLKTAYNRYILRRRLNSVFNYLTYW